MNIIQPFSTLDSRIYRWPALGRAAGRLMQFSEFFGLKLVKTCDWLAHGFKSEERKFQAELLNQGEEDCDFHRDLSKEKKYLKALIDAGIVKERITAEDHLARDGKIALNSAFLALTSPVSIPGAAAALGLRALLQNQMNPLVALAPNSYKVWNDEAPLSLFTANIAGTEFRIMDYINGVSATKPRVVEWGHFLSDLMPDVICLQEAFDVDTVYDHIAKRLQDEGYYVVMTAKRAETLGMTAGLLLASRYPIESVGFHEYTDGMGVDKRAAKGVLTARIALNEDVSICVATTHMQSGYPRGSLEDHVQWKKEQFDQATNFIAEFNESADVCDVFLIGDFNDGRFDQKGIAKVDGNYQYPSIVEGLLNKGIKDLTVPNRNDTFGDYYEHETDFDRHDPANVETGCAKGTCFNTAAPSYRHFVDLVALQVKKKVELPMKVLKRDVKLRLRGISIGNERLAKKIDDRIQKLRQSMYVKTCVVDHVCLFNRADNVFDAAGYDYEVITRPDLTDHRNLLLILYPL
jgi:hypothetical protein